MLHVMLVASDAGARHVFTPRWGPVVLSHVSCQGAAWVSLETLWRCMCFVYVYNLRLVHSVHVWDVSYSVCKIKRVNSPMCTTQPTGACPHMHNATSQCGGMA